MANINAIKKQIEQNSKAWHTADAATRKQLEQDNRELHAMLDHYTGSTSTFDSSTGKWSTVSASNSSKPSSSSRPTSSSSQSSSGSSHTSRPVSGSSSNVSHSSGGNNPYQSGKDDYGEIDYSVLLGNAIRAGASANEVESLLSRRVNKALANGYTQYAYDDVYRQAREYIDGKKSQQTLQGMIQVPEAEPVEDYSEYIKQLNALAQENALAELKAAYHKNVNAIDAARGQISPQYEAAKNQAAGQAAVQQRAWQETAAALGLNSGAAGQAALAQNVALQNDLNDLRRAESSDLAALELQRVQTETDYNDAIAQAQASGEYQLAQDLYAEKLRVDQENREAIALAFQQQLQAMQANQAVYDSDRQYQLQQQEANLAQEQFGYQQAQDALAQKNWREQFGYQQAQDALAQKNWQEQFAYEQEQNRLKGEREEQKYANAREDARYEQMLDLAVRLANYGNFSGFSALGMDEKTVSQMAALWNQDRRLAIQTAQAELEKTRASTQAALRR